MIPRLKPAIGCSELKAAFSFPGSSDVPRFESAFAELAGQKHAIAFPYGRTALVGILRALKLSGAEILCPSYTCVVVQHAIVTSGNTPVFIDSAPADFNMNLEMVDQAMTQNTRAIVITSLFGYPVKLVLVDRIRKRYPDLVVIQDCAHSFFCEEDGRPVHREGLCSFYGLNISKIMTSIFGGMVTTNDADFAMRLRQERASLLVPPRPLKSLQRLIYLLAVCIAFTRPVYGMVNRLERAGWLNRFVKYYDPGLIDMPADYLQSMTSIEARVGLAQCRKYHEIVEHRREISSVYRQGLAGVKDVRLPPDSPGATYSHFVVRSGLARHLKTYCLGRGVQLGELVDYYIPDMDAYQGCQNYGGAIGRDFPDEVVNLPVHMGTSNKDALRIVRLLLDCIESGCTGNCSKRARLE